MRNYLMEATFDAIALARATWKLSQLKPVDDQPIHFPMPRIIVGIIENA